MSRASWTTDAWREAEETLSTHVGVYHAQSRIERDLLSDVVCSDLAPCGEEVGECQCCEIFPRPVVVAFDDDTPPYSTDTDADAWADMLMDRAIDDALEDGR